MIRTLKHALGIAALVVLAGCESTVPADKLPEMTFRHLPSIPLLVSDVQIESRAATSTEPPNIAHLFPVPPEQALRNWARDRLAARGSAGTARVVIKKAEAIGTSMQPDRGIVGLFKKELSDRYEGQIEAELAIYDRSGQRRAFVEARADHAATVREDATLAERRRIMYELVERMMADFNVEMERGINTYLREHRL